MRNVLLLESLYFLIKIPCWIWLFFRTETEEVRPFAIAMVVVWTLLLLFVHLLWRPLQKRRGSIELAVALFTLLIPLEIRVYSFTLHFRPASPTFSADSCPPNLSGRLRTSADWVPWIEDGIVRGWVAHRIDPRSPWHKLGVRERDKLVNFEGRAAATPFQFGRGLDRFCAKGFYIEILRGDETLRLSPTH